MSNLARTDIVGLPKVLLHDHLDGGLRPATLIELASDAGIGLPATDEATLRDLLASPDYRGSLPRYLQPFAWTVAVMQTAPALRRVAAEAAEDLAADGVVYAEVRFGPELHLEAGLTMDDVVEAVLAGFREATGSGGPIIQTILCAIRTETNAREVADVAIRWRDEGVVAVDLAGPEDGYPASRHGAALSQAAEAGLGITIHAGEAAGVDSIADAVASGATRIGHGVRIIDVCRLGPDGETLGPLARHVRDHGITLELCPTSNVDTGIVTTISAHPFDTLRQLGFAVTVNTDNRLMSNVDLSTELERLAEAFDYSLEDLRGLMQTALDGAFVTDDVRQVLGQRIAQPSD